MIRTIFISTVSFCILGTAQVQAQNVAALVGDNTLAIIDSASLKAAPAVSITGVEGKVLGIDVRPSDGMLYGLFADGTVATIDATSGKATKVEMLKTAPPAGGMVTADFNPVADALRIMGSDGTNLRTKITGGAVATDKPHNFASDDMNAGKTPQIIAGAYTNSYKGTEKTALYTLDATNGVLSIQNPPNDGTQKSVGKLGIDVASGAAFDIRSDGKGGNSAFLVSGGKLLDVDLTSGKATEKGAITGIDGMVRDIAILP